MTTLVSIIPLARGPRRSFAALRTAAKEVHATFALRLARAPAWAWPLLTTLAAWPSLVWSVRRYGDGSDDPFGLVAWCALAFGLFVSRARFQRSPDTGHAWAAAALALVAALPLAVPDLLRAGVATLAIVAALAAIVDDDEPFVPYLGFALLALPLLSSLQFYAGFPLRVVTAEVTRWLLTADGSTVLREGTALSVDGRLVLVDAPCSGVRIAWIGYFTACFAAWLFRTANRAMLRRLPLVGALILSGNIVRNTILVALEARGSAGDTTHEAIGLAVTACVVVAIVALFASCEDRVRALRRVRVEARAGSRVDARARFFAPEVDTQLVVPALVLLVASVLPFTASHAMPATRSAHVEWPTSLDGEPLVPLALSDVERRFANDFPGSIGRFGNGTRLVVLRDVDAPTRKLHPAADCYRGLGYAIDHERLERDATGAMARCFTARRDGRGLRVCERIVDADGRADTDVSSWYWNALLGRSRGPWRATTRVQPLARSAGDAT